MPLRPNAIEELQAASAVGQGRLYRTYDELLRELGVQTAQVLLTFFDMSARTHYLNARRTLQTLLRWRIVPVINENDTTTTDEISFGDNDFLAAQVAVLTGARLLILLTDTDGLYTADPRVDPSAHHVDEVTDYEALSAMQIGHAVSPLGSGGMRSKVVAAEMATAAGISATIANGLRAGRRCSGAWAGEAVGTRFPPQSVRHSSFKLWLKYAKPSHGSVVVDAGAARALREGGTSLLPVGIVDVTGELRRRRRSRRPRARRGGDRQGHLQLLRAGAAPGHGPEVQRGARADAARDRGGRAPRLLRAGLRVRTAVARLGAAARSPRLRRMAVETTAPSVSDLCRAAKTAARSLAATDSATRDGALLAMAAALEARTDEILEANARDLEAGRESGLSAALMDRLALDEGRIAAMAAGVRAIVALPDPGRRGDRRPPARQRARRAQGPRARSASSRSSTRRARTSRSTPPPCA